MTLLGLEVKLPTVRPVAPEALARPKSCLGRHERWSYAVGVDRAGRARVLPLFARRGAELLLAERSGQGQGQGLGLAAAGGWRVAGGLPWFSQCAGSQLAVEGVTRPLLLAVNTGALPWKPHPEGWRVHSLRARQLPRVPMLRRLLTLLHGPQFGDLERRFGPIGPGVQRWARSRYRRRTVERRWDFQLGLSVMTGYIKRAALGSARVESDAQVDLPIGLRVTPRVRMTRRGGRAVGSVGDGVRLIFLGGPYRSVSGQLSLDFPVSVTYLAPLDTTSRRRFRIRAGAAVTLENVFAKAKLTLPTLLNLALPEVGVTLQKDQDQRPVWGFYMEFLRFPFTYQLTRHVGLHVGIGLTVGYRFIHTTSGSYKPVRETGISFRSGFVF